MTPGRVVSGPMSTPKPPDSQADAPEQIALVRTPSFITGVVGVIAVVVAGFLYGGKGALAATMGAIVVIAFFAGGQIVVGRVLRNNPALGMNTALLVYIVQIGLLFVLMLVLKNATFFNAQVFAFTVIVCVLTWILGAIIGFSRTKMLTVEPGSGPTGPPSPPNSGGSGSDGA